MPDRPQISLADVGAAPDGSDTAAAFAAALHRLPRTGGVLHVPPGVWRFARTDGVAVAIAAYDDLTIDGPGATLLFDGLVRPFLFSNCRSPQIRGLAIDWVRPPFSQGEVTRIGARDAEVRVDPDFPMDGSEAVRAIGTYDRATALFTHGGIDAYDVVAQTTRLGDQRLKLSFTRTLPLRVGDTIVMRHAIYAASAFTFLRCDDILVEDVTIRTAPGMGVYADHCGGGTVRRLVVAPPPGGTRLMSTTADAVHFNACDGRIVIEDCVMQGMGDDGVNIHGKYFRIAELVDARTAIVAAAPETLAGPHHLSPTGDSLALVDPTTLLSRETVRIVAAEAAGPGRTTLHFAGDLDPAVSAGDYAFDQQTRSQASVLRCRFPGNRARGVLAHSDTLIQDCRFAGQSAEAILLLPDSRFMEGPAAENVTIARNEFSDCLRLGRTGGAIRIGAAPAGTGPEAASVNRDITVRDNRFADIPGAAVIADATSGLSITGNRIARGSGAAIVLRRVRQVAIAGNVCAPPAAVAMSPDDRSEVTLSGNTGLSPA